MSDVIIDQFGRVHDYLRISLTDRCNLRCLYCMPEEGVPLRDKSEFMTAEETIEIAKEFVKLGVKKIRLTGGEPLIKKNIDVILHELSKLSIELAITTNGVVVDKYIDLLWDSGIRMINVSLDSLKEERFNYISRRSFFQRIQNNIQLLIQKGFLVKINVVVMRNFNEDEIVDFVKWTKNQPIHVRFIEFMPFDGNKWNWEQKVSHKEILSRVYSEFDEESVFKLIDEKNATARGFKLEGALGTFGIISSMTNPFCDTCNRIRLTADGKIKNCLFSKTETDLLSSLRNNVDLKPIILKSIYSKEKERGGMNDFENLSSENVKNRSMVAIGG